MKMKFRPAAAILAVMLAVAMLSGCVAVDNATIATVNDEAIGKGEFAFYFSQMQNTMLTEAQVASAEEANAFWKTTEIEGKKAADVARERALDEAVKIVLKCQKAEELGVSLTSEEEQNIDTQIGQVITNMGGKSAYEAELKNMGSSADSYRLFMEHNTLASKVDSKLSEDPAYAVSDEDASQKAKTDYIKAQHILIATQDTTTGEAYDDAKKAEQKAKAEDLLSQVKGGANFDELMAANSEDPGSQSSPEGYVFGKGEMVKPFEDAAYALEVDAISDLVESDFGYHIIKRVAMTDEDVQSRAEQAKSLLVNEKIDQQVDEWRKTANIVVEEGALSKMDVMEIEG